MCSYDESLLSDYQLSGRKSKNNVIPFIDIMKVEFDNCEDEERVQFRHKFNLYTREFNFEMYVKTNKEREMWIEAFSRTIENKHKLNATYWAAESQYYKETKQDWDLKKDKVKTIRLHRSIEVNVDGMEEFKSSNLFFNCNQLEGCVMKKITNKKVYHSKPFHKKYFQIIFSSGNIAIFNKKEDAQPSRVIPIHSLFEV